MSACKRYSVCLVDLGCAKNTVDSEGALGKLLSSGMEFSASPLEADLLLVNTCGFIESAREESLENLADAVNLKKQNRRLKVVAMGCLAQRYGKQLLEELPGLDGILGLSTYNGFLGSCERILMGEKIYSSGGRPEDIGTDPRLVLTGDVYAYLRISDGCDNCCSYCAVPLIRGSMRSRPSEEIIAEASQLSESGIKELCLVAQDIAAYGKDRYGEYRLGPLLEELLKNTDCGIRLLYAHPAHVQDDIIDLMAGEERLYSYIDLPIQHINDRILKDMGRHIDRAGIENLLGKLRSKVKGLTIRTSLICGFPGETDDEFAELLDFIKQGHFEHMGAFAYSREQDTKAFDLPDQIPMEVSEERVDAVMAAQQEVTFKWLDGRVGSTENVIIEEILEDGWRVGRGKHDAPEVDGRIFVDTEAAIGDQVPVEIKERNGYDLLAVPQE